MNYIRFLWDKKYVGLLIVLVCACLGSVRGAWKESGGAVYRSDGDGSGGHGKCRGRCAGNDRSHCACGGAEQMAQF